MKQCLLRAILLLFVSVAGVSLEAQQVEKNFEMGEVIRIAEAYQDLSYLSFQVQTIVSDSAASCCDSTITSYPDTVNGLYKLHDGRYWAMLDSVEYLQGFMYNLALYHKDKVIAVGKPSFDNRIMQLAVLDSTFQQVHVRDKMIAEPDSITRVFTITFYTESPYSGYEMRYNKNTHLLESVTYYVKNGFAKEDDTMGTAKVTTTFTNYNTTPFSSDYFREEKYIYKDRTGLKTKPDYSDYQVMVTEDGL